VSVPIRTSRTPTAPVCGGGFVFEATAACADVRVLRRSCSAYRPVTEWVARSWKLRAPQVGQEASLGLLCLAW
jgi:hypothetical protein